MTVGFARQAAARLWPRQFVWPSLRRALVLSSPGWLADRAIGVTAWGGSGPGRERTLAVAPGEHLENTAASGLLSL